MKPVVIFLGLILLTNACKNDPKQKLAALEKQELAKGIRHDSLLLGIHFGMTQDSFLSYCRGMNKKGVFNEGRNRLVDYTVNDSVLTYPLLWSFFPAFTSQAKIHEFNALVTYKNFVFGKADMTTENLSKEVKKLMEKWYGGTFFITELADGKRAYAQISGNRRILISVEKEYEILVTISDLKTE